MKRRDFLKVAAAAPVGLAAGDNRPVNLLFVMTDQQRFDTLGCAGNRIVSTPNLDRLAREGALFRNAISACPVCVPARTSILTGKSLVNTKVVGNGAAKDTEGDPGPSFDNLLHARGHKTQYYGKWHAPYRMARTYDNKVCPVGVRIPGVLTAKQNYLEYLDHHVPRRAPKPGERIDAGSLRPYTPAILDAQYEAAQQRKAQAAPPAEDDELSSQADEYGLLHIPKEHTHAAYTVTEALHALDAMKDGPFSLTCSIGPPHPPMLNVEPYWGMYPAGRMPLPQNFRHDMSWSPYRQQAARMTHYQVPENIRAMTSIYLGIIKEVDDNIGRLLARLDELKLAGNTLVIFTSDHGEMLGSHGMRGKATFHEESVHIPLLMRLPGAIRAGTVIETPVSHTDYFSTILDYLGEPAPSVDGRSLRPVLEGKSGYPDYAVSEWRPNTPNLMARTREWKLMMATQADAGSTDGLFNLKEDPYETRNLLAPADRAGYKGRAEEMRERLLAWCERVHAPYREAIKQRPLA